MWIAMAAKKPMNEFDIATLEKMTEPISIRITRIDRSSNNQIPLPLPQAEWSKEDARRIETIVLQDLGGGGLYNGEMSGANGVSFKWRFMYPENQFPPKFPAGMAAAMGAPPNGGMPHPASAPPGTVWTTAPYSGPGGAAVPAAAPYRAQSYQAPVSTPIMQHPYYPAPWGPQQQTAPASASSSFKEDQLRAEMEQLRRAAMDAEHRRERDAADARHAAEMAELRRAIQEKPHPDPQVEALKLQMQQQQQRWEQEREERRRQEEDRRRLEEDRRREAAEQRRVEEERRREEREREERRWREEQERAREERRAAEEQRRQEREVARQIEEARRREELAAREQAEKRFEMMMQMQQTQLQALQGSMANNPIVTMLGDSLRQSAQAQQDAARSAAEAPMKSMEMARLFKDLSGGDQLMKNIAEAYSGAHGISMRSVEMINQMMMQQQGSPGWEILSQAMEGTKEAINNFVTSKSRAERERSKVEQMQAQERMMAQQAAAAQAYAQQMAQEAASNPELQAAAQEAAAQAEAAKQQHADAINDLTTAASEAQVAAEKQEEREEKIFGIAYPQVLQVREHVGANTDENGQIPAEVGDTVAFGIVTGAVQIEAAGASVPAFDLLKERRYADIVEYMLPGVSGEFVGYCANRVEEFADRVKNRHSDQSPTDILNEIQTELFGEEDDGDEDDD